MMKNELKSGMIVTFRNGSKRMVVLNSTHGDGVTNFDANPNGKNTWKSLNDFTDDLKSTDGDTANDIMTVEDAKNKFNLIYGAGVVVWTRPDDAVATTDATDDGVRKLTMEQIRELIGDNFVIVG